MKRGALMMCSAAAVLWTTLALASAIEAVASPSPTFSPPLSRSPSSTPSVTRTSVPSPLPAASASEAPSSSRVPSGAPSASAEPSRSVQPSSGPSMTSRPTTENPTIAPSRSSVPSLEPSTTLQPSATVEPSTTQYPTSGFEGFTNPPTRTKTKDPTESPSESVAPTPEPVPPSEECTGPFPILRLNKDLVTGSIVGAANSSWCGDSIKAWKANYLEVIGTGYEITVSTCAPKTDFNVDLAVMTSCGGDTCVSIYDTIPDCRHNKGKLKKCCDTSKSASRRGMPTALNLKTVTFDSVKDTPYLIMITGLDQVDVGNYGIYAQGQVFEQTEDCKFAEPLALTTSSTADKLLVTGTTSSPSMSRRLVEEELFVTGAVDPHSWRRRLLEEDDEEARLWKSHQTRRFLQDEDDEEDGAKKFSYCGGPRIWRGYYFSFTGTGESMIVSTCSAHTTFRTVISVQTRCPEVRKRPKTPYGFECLLTDTIPCPDGSDNGRMVRFPTTKGESYFAFVAQRDLDEVVSTVGVRVYNDGKNVRWIDNCASTIRKKCYRFCKQKPWKRCLSMTLNLACQLSFPRDRREEEKAEILQRANAWQRPCNGKMRL